LIVKADVPGMDPKDMEVSIHENLLTMEGEKKQEKDERFHRVERSYGAFTRSVKLPVGVDAGRVKGNLQERALDGDAAEDSGVEGDLDRGQGGVGEPSADGSSPEAESPEARMRKPSVARSMGRAFAEGQWRSSSG
jgi:hypothetical protein